MKKRLIPSLLLCALFLFFALSACSDAAFLTGGGPKPAYKGGDDSTLSVHFLDVGQADAALLLCDGSAMLIDGGNVEDSSLVAAYLKEQGVKHLDYVVATHAHEDHVGGLSGALNVCSVDTVFSPVKDYNSTAFRDFAKYVSAQKKSITIPKAGETFQLGSATVELFGPQKSYPDENNSSIVLKVTHGKNSFLFTGDAEREAENDLLDAGLDLGATVLKVAHHGSDTSSSYRFLRAVQPEYAVISVGEGNSYGHPDEATLSRLRDAAVKLYRTDMQGHIIVTSDQKTLSFTTTKTATTPTNPTESNGSGQNGKPLASYYIGNLSSHKLHLPTCTSLPDEQNQIRFGNLDEALQAGYTPCGYCMK